jgi:hypothetical protein
MMQATSFSVSEWLFIEVETGFSVALIFYGLFLLFPTAGGRNEAVGALSRER